MALITRHREGMGYCSTAWFSGVCGIHYVWLSFFQMEKQNHYKSCDLLPIWVKFYILNREVLHFKIQMDIADLP